MLPGEHTHCDGSTVPRDSVVKPSGHAMHSDAPVKFWYDPRAHNVQAWPGPGPNDPGTHVQFEASVEAFPSVELRGGQAVHATLPLPAL